MIKQRIRKLTKAPLLILLGIGLLAAPIVTFGKSETDNKGPIGWDIYRQLDRLTELKSGVETYQFSSYDRKGFNDDGFVGTYSCIEKTSDGCVIADYKGAGEIDSIWFTRDEGDVTKSGNIQIILDGKKVVDSPLQDVVNGKLGAPFVYPLVANADQTSGGVYIKIPMPFKKSMRVITKNNPLFHHVTYRTFTDSESVNTFDPADQALDVVEMLKKAGTEDPKPKLEKADQFKKNFTLKAGEKITLANLNAPGIISELRLRIPQIEGPKVGERAIDDGRAFTGYSEYQAKIDPKNEGIRITRRLDTVIGNQLANILIDGVKAGEWSKLPTGGPGWTDQVVEIPGSFTKDKASVTIRNAFVSSDVDFNEFTYWVDSKVNGEWVRTDTMNMGPDSLDNETAHSYKIVDSKWEGVRNYQYPTTGDASVIAASDEILQKTRLRIYFDEKLMVDSPVGEFFGSGLGEYNVKSLLFSMDTTGDGWYTSWWPMPYGKSAKIELVNESSQDLNSSESSVTYEKSGHWAKALGPKPTSGYFRTTSVSGETTAGFDWQFLNAVGKGTVVGVTQTMEGKDLKRDYLEGDERVFTDQSAVPQIHGTGTEDFYESGWYFNRGTFSNPLNGNPVHEVNVFGSQFDSTGAYRLFIGDSMPFQTSIRFGIEHGPVNDVSAHYGSTTYWYGSEQ
ncbi:glycoside hydrolase family 172 protein [Neobacillus jeddahensis]|uniref:glycoside hydrolase family 172 protein n=1 Tax=Neobacillus jeddahensis TaxID=1461580 RepID=UPI00069464D4|nr:glycoside hydrolase family 172 protein [Neobacillus jeddahensis]